MTMMMSLIISSRRRGGELISFHAGLAQVRRGFLRGPSGIRASLRGLACLPVSPPPPPPPPPRDVMPRTRQRKKLRPAIRLTQRSLARSLSSCRATIKQND